MSEVLASQKLEGWDHVTQGDWEKIQSLLSVEIPKARMKGLQIITLRINNRVDAARAEELRLLATVGLKQVQSESKDTHQLTIVLVTEAAAAITETSSHAVLETAPNHALAGSPEEDAAAQMLSDSATMPAMPKEIETAVPLSEKKEKPILPKTNTKSANTVAASDAAKDAIARLKKKK